VFVIALPEGNLTWPFKSGEHRVPERRGRRGNLKPSVAKMKSPREAPWAERKWDECAKELLRGHYHITEAASKSDPPWSASQPGKLIHVLLYVLYATTIIYLLKKILKLTLTNAIKNNKVMSAAGGCRPQRRFLETTSFSWQPSSSPSSSSPLTSPPLVVML
jgi:hypothetical protein